MQYAFALKRLGAVLLRADQFGEAEGRYRAALALEEPILANLPAADSDNRIAIAGRGVATADGRLCARLKRLAPQHDLDLGRTCAALLDARRA